MSNVQPFVPGLSASRPILSASVTITAAQAAGDVLAAWPALSPGEQRSVNATWLAINSTGQLVRGAGPLPLSASPAAAVTQTFPTGAPIVTPLTVTNSNPTNLGGLSLSSNALSFGEPFSAAIVGRTPGSRIEVGGPGAVGLSLSHGVVSGIPRGVGDVILTETLVGAGGSPTSTVVGSSIITPGAGGGGNPAVPTQHQLVGTFTAFNNGSSVDRESPTTNQGRNGHHSGRVSASRLKILDSVTRLGIGGAEVAGVSAVVTLQRALEISGVTKRALYSGSTSINMTGTDLVMSDEIPDLVLPADTLFFTRFLRTIPLSTDQYNSHLLSGPGSRGFRTSGASQLLATGEMDPSGTSGGPVIWPTMILGVPSAPMASVVIVGDSIANYRDDSNTSTAQGFLTRAFQNIGGFKVPWHKQTQNAHTLHAARFANAPKQKEVWRYVTDIVIALGTNSISTSGTVASRLAACQASLTEIASGARAITGPYGKRLRVHACSIIPRGGFDNDQNAVRLQFNAWLASGADGLVDKYYDTNAAAGDFTTYPSDQIHPGPTDHANMAAVVAAGFVPYLDPYYGL